ncbi:MAG: hypothetical protein R2784_10570 [Saprospiraceae bacterium]
MRKLIFTLLLFNFFSSLSSTFGQNLTLTVEDQMVNCEQDMVSLDITD